MGVAAGDSPVVMHVSASTQIIMQRSSTSNSSELDQTRPVIPERGAKQLRPGGEASHLGCIKLTVVICRPLAVEPFLSDPQSSSSSGASQSPPQIVASLRCRIRLTLSTASPLPWSPCLDVGRYGTFSAEDRKPLETTCQSPADATFGAPRSHMIPRHSFLPTTSLSPPPTLLHLRLDLTGRLQSSRRRPVPHVRRVHRAYGACRCPSRRGRSCVVCKAALPPGCSRPSPTTSPRTTRTRVDTR